MDDRERVLTHYGPTGPVQAAWQIVDGYSARDFDMVWGCWHPVLQRDAATLWATTNKVALEQQTDLTVEDIIGALTKRHCAPASARSASDADLWASFSYTQLHSAHEGWAHFLALHASQQLGAASATRIVAPGMEAVLFTETQKDQPMVIFEPTPVHGLTFVMHHSDAGWLAVSLDGSVPDLAI